MIKTYILAAACCLPVCLMAQKGYTISGKISGLKEPAKVYLATVQSGAFKDTDSADIKDGVFQLNGSLSEPTQAILRVKRLNTPGERYNPDQLGLFIENAPITVTATDSIKNATVKGSVAEKENRELEALTRPLTNSIIRLNNEFAKKPKEDEGRKKASDSVTYLVAKIKDTRLKFVESHLNSFMGLYNYHYYILDSKFDPAVVEPIFHKFSAQLKSSELGKRTAEKIEIGKRRQAGVKVTDFTQNDLNDKPFKLSSLRGKYVLVDFWASWCVPCRAENPNVVKAYQELKGKNFEIVGVSLDQGKAAWEGAVQKDGLPWIHVSDLNGWQNKVALMYGINSVPQNLLINPEGMIIAKNLRGEALTDKLKELVK
ncbi:AhpC/TSA family protein [Segetibacter sp. 3557_3]|uniref:TlpA disulfide reductase family protein n=1 Tax=Segetibacter sp. 3557_3 TaxID=2547429 RepID=UPI001058BF3A|nr:TlpA disulfide reductase family protein [Segetibacter sp. 3557_3]TDH20687.1 AhpC/TSA family protein [Segetibacter sp. 3557_3]